MCSPENRRIYKVSCRTINVDHTFLGLEALPYCSGYRYGEERILALTMDQGALLNLLSNCVVASSQMETHSIRYGNRRLRVQKDRALCSHAMGSRASDMTGNMDYGKQTD